MKSDHKPLIPIFDKDLNKVSITLQRMLLKLLKYKIKIVYLPGKEMYIADTLSRAYLKTNVPEDPEMSYIVHALSNNIPMSEEKKIIFQKATETDRTLKQIKLYCETQWPNNSSNMNYELKFYYKLKDSIYLSNNLLFLNKKVVVPTSLRKEMLEKIHESHLGIVKCKLRAREILYWPNMCQDIEKFISKCEVWQLNQRSNQKETLISHELPTRPWQFLSTDFLEFNKRN